MDDFEKNIKENKLLFDEYKADKAKLWERIESELDITPQIKKVKTIKLWKSPYAKIAASILIIFGAFSLINLFMGSTNNLTEQHIAMNQELQDIDTYYKGLVSFQVELVKKNAKLTEDDKEDFLSFMDELDQEYLLLKEEMTANLNNEYILEAIVQNYKKRIELIENLLEQIKDSRKSDENEGYIL
ncbi:hypothetical protein SAMN04487910_4140 [Aquimarina amphilecti]|uniref:Anti-sigma factor n=1 Tax=Aquimarina amphilecti TaxID=1038014 RepID=A0A1H7VR51_AQUAM|nr:hypothetical protein [Aquimarina amphilecti]SEM11359.1 hypothetical protein SAMN04487910_4140 [Aquimarina amphilecti]